MQGSLALLLRLRGLELADPGRAALHPGDGRSGRALPVVRDRRRRRRRRWPWRRASPGRGRSSPSASISVLTVFWVRRFVRADAANSDLPDLNVRGQQYVGRSLVVEQAIQNGRGKVRVGDTLWHAEGPDVPGRRARHRHGGQGHRAGGGACGGMTAIPAPSPGSIAAGQHGPAVARHRPRPRRRLAGEPRRSRGLVAGRRRRRLPASPTSSSTSSGRIRPSPRATSPTSTAAPRSSSAACSSSPRPSRAAAARCASATRCGSPRAPTSPPAPASRSPASAATRCWWRRFRWRRSRYDHAR